MRTFSPRLAVMALAATLLVGCATAPQLPVDIKPEVLAAPNVRVGLVVSALPKADTSFPGAGCLLCLAAANVAHSSLNAHVQTLPTDEMGTVKTQVLSLLRKRGAQVMDLSDTKFDALPDFKSEAPNFARKDFTSLAAKHGIDKLLVINVHQMGVVREYSAYIPTSAPKATVAGLGYIVNLKTNGLDWYMPFSVQKAAEGEWDEAPKFPGLTNAYFQSIEAAKDAIITPLLRQ